MDWWPVIKVIWGGLGLGVAGLVLIAVWRARGVWRWNRAIRKELKALSIEASHARPARKAAILGVIAACGEVSGSFAPAQVVDAARLQAFIRSIAACFFPQAERPELQISLGQLIKSLDASLSRFDQILHRPGLKQINTVTIKTIRNLYHWSNDLVKRPWVRWYVAHRKEIDRFSLIRLLVFPDPLSLILFLSRKILILLLLKRLLLDMTLFLGKLAIDAFDQESDRPAAGNSEDLEAALESLSQVDIASPMENDPDIAAIRHKLVGFSTVILSNPTLQAWKAAVREAAEILARRYFPHSDHPLEEAAVGPLLDRTRSLLGTLGKGNSIFLVRYVYKTRIETLFQAKDISGLILTPTVRGIFRTSAAAHGWIKWPLKIYRRLRRFSLPGIAADVGWVLGKKSALMLIYGRTFDQACRELNTVYRKSAAMDRSGIVPPAG